MKPIEFGHGTESAQVLPMTSVRSAAAAGQMKTLVALAWLVACLLGVAAPVRAQPIVEYVTLMNGDRFTGEIKGLDRGTLELSVSYSPNALYIEWDKVVNIQASRIFEVVLDDGRSFLGSLTGVTNGVLDIKGPVGDISITLQAITAITPIGRSFWRKLDGSFDVGYSYTKSSGISQLNLNSETTLRNPRVQWGLSISFTQTSTEGEEGTDDRGWIELSHVRNRWTNWFVGVSGRFETNESLGIRLRSQGGGVVGPWLVRNNRSRVGIGAGLAFSDELATGGDRTENLEGLFMFRSSYFTYDTPKTNLDVSAQYYPSLSDWGRQRLQFNSTVKREIVSDFFVSVSVYDTFDSRPPGESADKNDVGVVFSVGWSY